MYALIYCFAGSFKNESSYPCVLLVRLKSVNVPSTLTNDFLPNNLKGDYVGISAQANMHTVLFMHTIQT